MSRLSFQPAHYFYSSLAVTTLHKPNAIEKIFINPFAVPLKRLH
jgi:hypothetical protein